MNKAEDVIRLPAELLSENLVVQVREKFFLDIDDLSGGVYNPRGQARGEGGVAQMTTTLNNRYLVKVSTCPKFCPRGLYTAPYEWKI